MSNQTPQNVTSLPSDTVQTNFFTQFPPIIPMVVIAVALVTLAQFPSTERFAAAFAWLIFFAVLFADSGGAFQNISTRITQPAPGSGGAGGGKRK